MTELASFSHGSICRSLLDRHAAVQSFNRYKFLSKIQNAPIRRDEMLLFSQQIPLRQAKLIGFTVCNNAILGHRPKPWGRCLFISPELRKNVSDMTRHHIEMTPDIQKRHEPPLGNSGHDLQDISLDTCKKR